jgi:hypothetical protein
MQEIKRFKFKKNVVQFSDEYEVIGMADKYILAQRHIEEEVEEEYDGHIPDYSQLFICTLCPGTIVYSDHAHNTPFLLHQTTLAELSNQTSTDNFSDACFLPESEDVEEDLTWCADCRTWTGAKHEQWHLENKYCDVCLEYVGPSHSHIGETIKERDTSDWANSIGRQCDVCGHMDQIFPYSNGQFGSSLDFCTMCEAPWGHGQDHDRWADDYVEHTKEPALPGKHCVHCGILDSEFTGTEDCYSNEDGFHEWILSVQPEVAYDESLRCIVCEGPPSEHSEKTHPFDLEGDKIVAYFDKKRGRV